MLRPLELTILAVMNLSPGVGVVVTDHTPLPPKQKIISQLKIKPIKTVPKLKPRQIVKPKPKPVVAPRVHPPANCSSPKMCIYMKESGNNPAAVNPGGCRGLGQACPGSKLPCSSSDYACQDRFFTNYAMQRYGSWANAWTFWQKNNWW